jgi:hypothetical protein
MLIDEVAARTGRQADNLADRDISFLDKGMPL